MKRLVRDVILPNKDLGHVDRNHKQENQAAASHGVEKEKEEENNTKQHEKDEDGDGDSCPNIN